MNVTDLKIAVALGEDSSRQFKADVRNSDSLASEMAAFANSNGGTILIGVADDGSLPGLSGEDVSRINQLIGNSASQHVRSPLTVHSENVALESGRIVIVLTVPKGIDKPYFDKNGVIWLKTSRFIEKRWKAWWKSVLYRKSLRNRRESVGKASSKILLAIQQNNSITIPQLASIIGVTERSIERNIQKLQAENRLRRVGGRKEGHWEVTL